MGLSSTEVVSSKRCSDWSQISMPEMPNTSCLDAKLQNCPNLQPTESLNCPRCDSTNTKFCYYNNYSRSQPRYFCKTCKRHWTKGGTLRSVPIGGGRKNKRPKRPLKSASTSTSTLLTSAVAASRKTITLEDGRRLEPEAAQKSTTIFASSQPRSGVHFLDDATQGSTSSSQNPYQVSEAKLFSSALAPSQSSSVYNYVTTEAMEDPAITTIMPSTGSTIISQAWQLASASNGMEYWNWDDIDNFVSTDLNISWEDLAEIKP